MNICGIMAAKEKSTRFPHKNRILFEENAKLLLKVCGFGNVYMFTDDQEIKNKCYMLGIPIIDKCKNFDDELPYIETIKYSYRCLNKEYDYIVSILCNTVGHYVEPIYSGIEMMRKDSHIHHIKSYDDQGNQSGIHIYRANDLPEKTYHQAAIISNGREIHYENEL